MKNFNFFITAVTLLLCYSLTAQVSINNDGATSDPSAMLDVKSTDKGMLMPRMTLAEITAIENPADGLIVYNTNDKKFYFFDGGVNNWKEIAIGTGVIYAGCGTLTDIDGNQYLTTPIGLQCWMAENLATTKYNDGTSIPYIINSTAWANLTTPAYCWYDNDQVTNGDDYGAMYNWHAVNTGSLCPTGWHVPTDEDWATLVTFAGGEAVAGGKLKETGTTHWDSPNADATDEYGFAFLPGGQRDINGQFYQMGGYGFAWSATEDGSSTAWGWQMAFTQGNITRYNHDKKRGMSIRCLKD